VIAIAGGDAAGDRQARRRRGPCRFFHLPTERRRRYPASLWRGLSSRPRRTCRADPPDARIGPSSGRTRKAKRQQTAPQGEAMVANDRQRGANRANAARSIGPRTNPGKAATRLNALRHGLAAASHYEPGADL
jgi:hypothetical protein